VTGDRSARPCNSTRDLHAVAFVESANDCVLTAHGKVKIAARCPHDFVHELPEDPAARTIELISVKNLVQHDRASGHLHVSHAGTFPVLLVCDDHAVLVDALPRCDLALELVLPNVRKHVPVRSEMPVDRLKIVETCVSHWLLLLEHEDRLTFESAPPDMLQPNHFAQLKVQRFDQMPAVVLSESDKDLR